MAPTPARNPLLVTISGIRGIAGSQLSPRAIVSYVTAFARMTKARRMVLGHDARPSAKWILPLVEGTLRGLGVEVCCSGLTPTPTLGILIRSLRADAGINVTASHNPIDYNGLKFFSKSGTFITKEMLAALIAEHARVESGEENDQTPVGTRRDIDNVVDFQLAAMQKVFPFPPKKRNASQLRVIIDGCNSTGAIVAPDVADAYGALFQTIFADKTKYSFPRGPEPTEANIHELCRRVKAQKADIGFAIDPDGDRLALVDETGKAIGEERTLVLCADAFLELAKRKSPIVVNLSTSRAVEDVAAKHKVRVIRTAIGEANVVAALAPNRARIGGEGNGGVIVPAVQPGRDAAVAIALILLGLQKRGGTLSQWNASFPSYSMIKLSSELDRSKMGKAISRIRGAFSDASINDSDGIKASYADKWIHVRASNTEPVVRIYAEAKTESEARALIGRALNVLK